MTKVGIFITVTENQDKEILKINSSGTHNWQTHFRTHSFDCIRIEIAFNFGNKNSDHMYGLVVVFTLNY